LKKNLYQNKINKVYDYLQYNNIAGAGLKELSQIADLSPFHFHRIFKAVTGETLGEFIVRIKLEKAAKLLSDSKATISQVAYDVGFETPSSLSKAFKKRYNVSPTQYRQGESINCKVLHPSAKPLSALQASAIDQGRHAVGCKA
jgi:AraC family transcriptional regulator